MTTNQHTATAMTQESPQQHSQRRGHSDGTIELRINATVIMSVLLVLLLGFSTVQAVELSRVKNVIEDGGTLIESATGASTTSTSTSPSSAIDNLPDMVGGC